VQAVCETYWEKTRCNDIATMSRRCRARNDCKPGSFNECRGICYFDWRKQTDICYKCNYGVDAVWYKCEKYRTYWCSHVCETFHIAIC